MRTTSALTLNGHTMYYRATTLPNIGQVRRRRAVLRFVNVWRARINRYETAYATIGGLLAIIVAGMLVSLIADFTYGGVL